MTIQIFYLDLIDDSLKHWMIHIAIMTPQYFDVLPLAIPPVISLMTQPCFSDIYSKDFVEQSSGWRRMDSHNLKLWEYNFLFNFRRKGLGLHISKLERCHGTERVFNPLVDRERQNQFFHLIISKIKDETSFQLRRIFFWWINNMIFCFFTYNENSKDTFFKKKSTHRNKYSGNILQLFGGEGVQVCAIGIERYI